MTLDQILHKIQSLSIDEISVILTSVAFVFSIGSFILLLYSVVRFRVKFDHQNELINDRDKTANDIRKSAKELSDVLAGLKMAVRYDRTEK